MDVSIVIVSWNVRRLIGRCIQTLQESTDVSFEIIVVDNNSSDGSEKYIREQFPEVIFIQMGFNSGFSKAVNAGATHASGKYLFVLNPDSEVRSDTLAELVQYANAHESVGLISPKIINPDGTYQAGSVRRFPTLVSQLLIKANHISTLRKRIPSLKKYFMDDFDPNAEQDIEQVMGAAMFMRRLAFNHIGGFDERFYIWFEDIDLSKRFHNAGFGVRYYPRPVVIHHGGESFKQRMTVRKQWIFSRSAAQYFFKHHGFVQGVIMSVVIPINLLVTVLFSFLRKK